jgi:hypothetical protein
MLSARLAPEAPTRELFWTWKPTTDAMLRNPPPGDWLHWRRTYDGWAHSLPNTY